MTHMIAAEYLMGVRVRKIAAAYSVSPAQVVIVARRYGLPSRKDARAITPDEHATIRAMRGTMPAREAARRTGRNQNTIYQIWEGYR